MSESPKALSTGWSQALLVVRLLLAGLFLFSGALKLGFAPGEGSPFDFALAIKAFKLLDYGLIPFTTFVIPWIEVVAGVLVLVGAGSRAAAQALNFLLVIFILAMIAAIARGLDVDCGCFGEFLGMKVSWFSIGRNVVIMAFATMIVMKGAGRYSLDAVLAGRISGGGCGCGCATKSD